MDNTTDFTFCQVGQQEDVNNLDSHETIPGINGMTLEDDNLDGGYIHKIGNSIQDDYSHEIERLKDSGSKGSPSNNFIDVLIPKSKVNESLTKTVVGETDDSVNQSLKQKAATKKPAVRAKVPFEKGYSQMDWLKLTRTESVFAGLRGQSNRRLISMDEVRQHKAEGSIWTVLKGRVYNISPYMKFHPGGVDMLMKAAGKDCTILFNKYHAWVNAEFLLEKCLVGVLDDS